MTIPAARNTDPHTSHAADEFMTASGRRAAQQQMTVKAVECYPGLTSLELSDKTSMDRYVLARRLPECERDFAVKRGPSRRCTISGRDAVTWWRPSDDIQVQPTLPGIAA